MAKQFVCKVLKESKSGSYIVHTLWEDHQFTVNIASENGAWTGKMTKEMVSSWSAQLHLTPENYLSKCQRMLTQCNGDPEVVYAIENNTFVWKKVEDEDSGIKIRYGLVEIQPTNLVTTLHDMLDASIKFGCQISEELGVNRKEKSTGDDNLSILWEKLEQQTITKDEMEKKLMNGFLNLLNSKKKRIIELEEKLRSLENCQILPKVYRKKYERKSKKEKEEIEILEKEPLSPVAEDINPYDMDTEDDEETEKRVFIAAKPVDSVISSTSAAEITTRVSVSSEKLESPPKRSRREILKHLYGESSPVQHDDEINSNQSCVNT